VLADDASAEISVVGNEGLIGIALLGDTEAPRKVTDGELSHGQLRRWMSVREG
jgi:hypothetical protein